MSIILNGDTSGSATLQATTGTSTVQIPAISGTLLTDTYNNYNGFKNRIINGAMNIVQSKYPTTLLTVATGISRYIDRWYLNTINTNIRFLPNATTGVFPLVSAVAISRANATTTTDPVYFTQIIESINMLDLAGKVVTLSFYARISTSTTMNLSVQLVSGSVADEGSANMFSWTGQQLLVSASVPITTTLTRYTYTATIPTNAKELQVRFTLTPVGTAIATDTINITGVQLEQSSQVTDFEYRPYQVELNLCKRYNPVLNFYVQNINPDGTISRATLGDSFYAIATSTTNVRCTMPFTVPTRVAPTGLLLEGGTSFQVGINGQYSGTFGTAATFLSAGTTSGTANYTITAGSPTVAANQICNLSLLNANSFASLTFTGCEL